MPAKQSFIENFKKEFYCHLTNPGYELINHLKEAYFTNLSGFVLQIHSAYQIENLSQKIIATHELYKVFNLINRARLVTYIIKQPNKYHYDLLSNILHTQITATGIPSDEAKIFIHKYVPGTIAAMQHYLNNTMLPLDNIFAKLVDVLAKQFAKHFLTNGRNTYINFYNTLQEAFKTYADQVRYKANINDLMKIVIKYLPDHYKNHKPASTIENESHPIHAMDKVFDEALFAWEERIEQLNFDNVLREALPELAADLQRIKQSVLSQTNPAVDGQQTKASTPNRNIYRHIFAKYMQYKPKIENYAAMFAYEYLKRFIAHINCIDCHETMLAFNNNVVVNTARDKLYGKIMQHVYDQLLNSACITVEPARAATPSLTA